MQPMQSGVTPGRQEMLILHCGKRKTSMIRIPVEQRLIPVDISRVSLEKQQDCRFIELLWRMESLLNSPQFNHEKRARVCLHEAAHLFYTRRVGFEPKLFSPYILYNQTSDVFEWCAAAVGAIPDDLNAPMLEAAKIFVAPEVIMPTLLPGCRSAEQLKNDCKTDLTYFRSWYSRHVDLPEEAFEDIDLGFQALREEALASVTVDLQSPRVRRDIWACAREFEDRVFPSEM
jgi:hypothetical protein